MSRRRTPADYRPSRNDANEIFDALKVSLATLDGSLRIIRTNRLFRETFRLSRARGRPLSRLGNGMWNAPALREKVRALRKGVPFTGHEHTVDLPARGSRVLSISGLALPRGAQPPQALLIAVVDLSARLQSAEAEALRKVEGRQRDFVANVSHELMTPITAIKGYAEALLSGALDVSRKRLKFTQIIEKHADRLTQLVEDLLQLSTSETGPRKSVDAVPLAENIQRLVMDLAPLARKRGISIRVKTAPELRAAMNKNELNQILQNLVSNAIKYNRSRGRIVISAHVLGKRLVVAVRDTGIGVPKEDLTRIFDRFHRAANARSKTERGSGLGLSIVKSILVAHGCRIWAESEPGKGTTFFFTLPKA
jgi:two-component system phosphate regulon sensor histidine kinase PhoR